MTVATQPTNPQQTCTVSGGTGTVGTSDVTSVTVDCMTDQFTIGGSVLGLVGTSVLTSTLSGGATDEVTIAADGTYAFPTAVPMGTTFAIAVDTQPATALCYVVGPTATPGMGTVGTADVADVDIRCVGTPTVAAVASSCDTSSNPITWSEVPGATYTLSYRGVGHEPPERDPRRHAGAPAGRLRAHQRRDTRAARLVDHVGVALTITCAPR